MVNAANRLTQQDDRASGGALNVAYAFTYDANDNRTQETKTRPGKPNRVTTMTFNKANWLVATTDPGGGTTTYSYDAAGNRTGTTDPLGITTAITYNALNLPAQTTHTVNPLVDTTTNTYDARNNLQSQRTVAGSLTLTTTTNYNSNNYLSTLNNSTQQPPSANGYTVGYTDNNLAQTITPGYYSGDYGLIYDSANRVRCWHNGILNWVVWSYYPDGNRKYQYYGFLNVNGCYSSPYEGEPDQNYFATRENYYYTGQKLARREWQPYGGWDPPNAPPTKVSTYGYDSGGNLASEVRADYTNGITTTTSYDWTWQASANRLTNLTASSGMTTTLEYDSLGRITRRYTALGYSDYIYEDGTDRLIRERWHSSISSNTFDLVRYQYTIGRPTRIEIVTAPGDLTEPGGYNSYYIQYNWHGDVDTYVDASNGTGGGSWGAYDAWGNPSFWPPPDLGKAWTYYRWNGAWGYLKFDGLGLYYVHGRWYNQDTGMWLSPDENGEYLYGSGQDAVNWAWCGIFQSLCVGWGWLTETAPETMYFGPNDPMTRDLMNDEGVNAAREKFYRNLKAGTLRYGTDDDFQYQYMPFNYVREAMEFVLPTEWGGDRTGFFLGSYTVKTHKNDGTVSFTVSDDKGWESATRSSSYYGPDLVNILVGRFGWRPFGEHSSYSVEGLLFRGQRPNPAGLVFGPKSLLEDRSRSDPGFFSGVFGDGLRIGGKIYLRFIWIERIPPERMR